MKKVKIIICCLAVMVGFHSAAMGKSLKIGTLSPLTGPYAQDGTDILQGVETAVAVIEKAGGLPGFDKIERHGLAHNAQSDKPDFFHVSLLTRICREKKLKTFLSTTATLYYKYTAFTWWERLSAANIATTPCCRRLSRLESRSHKVRQPSQMKSDAVALNTNFDLRRSDLRFFGEQRSKLNGLDHGLGIGPALACFAECSSVIYRSADDR